jgi:hypothetical protein
VADLKFLLFSPHAPRGILKSKKVSLDLMCVEHDYVYTTRRKVLNISNRCLPLWASEGVLNCGEIVVLENRNEVVA